MYITYFCFHIIHGLADPQTQQMLVMISKLF